MSRLMRIAVRTAIIVAILLLVGSISTLLILRSGWFHERVRQRVIAEIEKSTGGQVDIGNFGFDWDHLTVTLGPMVVHGTEPANESPLLSIQSLTLGLRIVSMLERKVDLASLRIEHPAVRVVYYGDGKTNLPAPRVHDDKSWAQGLIDLAVGHYEVVDGMLDYDNRVIPFNFSGKNLQLRMDYEPLRARYRGDAAFKQARLMAEGLAPFELAISSGFAFDAAGIQISNFRASYGDSHVDLAGTLSDVRAPHGTLNMKSSTSIRDAIAILKVPATGLARSGSATFEGQLAIDLANPSAFSLAGQVSAKGLGYSDARVKVNSADLRAKLQATSQKIELDQLTMHGAGATAMGRAQLDHLRDFQFEGTFEGLTIADVAKAPWNGNVSGNAMVTATLGRNDAKVAVTVAVARAATGPALEGNGEFAYDQASNTVRMNAAHFATASTSVEASGMLGSTLNVHAQSTNLDELLPALQMIDPAAPKDLPVKLNHGRAEFLGTISGAASDPRAQGHVTATNAVVDGHAIDTFAADIDTTRHQVDLQSLTLTHGAMQVDGSASISARNDSFADGVISTQLNVRNAQIADLAKEWKIDTSISGMAAGTAQLSGSIESPVAQIAATVENASGFGEKFERLRGNVRYSDDRVEINAGEASGFGGTLRFEGAFDHARDDFKNGTIRFQVAAQNVALAKVEQLRKVDQALDGVASGQATGTARLVNNQFQLDSINGSASARGLAAGKQPLGDVTLTAGTRGTDLRVRGSGKLRDLMIDAQGSWKFTGDAPGSMTVHFSRASVATFESVVMAGGPRADSTLPFDGFIDGANATVNIALRKPRDFHAELTVAQVQLEPKPAQTLRLGVQAPDLVVKNSKPLVIDITSQEARIRSAEFTARDTSLEVAGGVPFNGNLTGASGAGLTVRGSVNLIVLQLLNPELAARGNATVQASIRGSLKDPQITGRLDLKNASLYLSDLPNGVDNASGALIFDNNRATIEKLTAETGGGTVNFTGFLGFGSPLVYRLQAVAQKVRVRYPEDVSVTMNATLALNGTSDASTVSGVVTMMRAAFTPRADFAQVLAQAARPVSAPVAASEYIRGMQFDVRIETGPNFEFQTSLARNLEAEIDLRLRGTPLRPVLLGSVSVNQGEVQVFGNKYTVNRGDIRFVNQVRVDPIFDMDLETKARGVTVNIAISGTTQKLNVNYSSDPPMQPRDIIALLAVGRSPTETAGINATPSTASSTSLNDAGGSLIGQAISAQLSSRLQRFFGASRVKIDPTLTGADYLPQARLTIEQQVSQAITLTYITNLNRTQEQIVQIEWDFSKQWSAVAVREASGLFGIDIQYRKRFK